MPATTVTGGHPSLHTNAMKQAWRARRGPNAGKRYGLSPAAYTHLQVGDVMPGFLQQQQREAVHRVLPGRAVPQPKHNVIKKQLLS